MSDTCISCGHEEEHTYHLELSNHYDEYYCFNHFHEPSLWYRLKRWIQKLFGVY